MRAARRPACRTVLEEGTNIRASCALLALLLLAAGCGKKNAAPPPAAEKPKDGVSEIERVIGSSGGKLISRDKDTHELRWEVSWESVDFEIKGTSQFGGKMKNVTGVFYENGKPASTFKAAVAQSPTGSEILSLDGGVKVTSDSMNTTVSCDQVRYVSQNELIEAKGNIKIDADTYKVQGIEVINADPGLNQFATPDLFKKKS